MPNEYDHIFYDNHPHFTVGEVDQWGEQGFLFFEGRVFHYWENRKDQCGETSNPMTIETFMEYAKQQSIEIPEAFMRVLFGGNAVSNT